MGGKGMLKYLAIFQALDGFTLGLDAEQLKRAHCVTHKSPTFETPEQANKWLECTSKAYPEKKYKVHHCVISFEESERENVEKMLRNLIKMF